MADEFNQNPPPMPSRDIPPPSRDMPSQNVPTRNMQGPNPTPPSAAVQDRTAELDQAHENRMREGYPATLPDHIIDAAVRDATATSGRPPVSIDHIGAVPENVVVRPQFAVNTPPRPGTFWAQSSTYIIAIRDIMASSVGMAVTSYTFDASTVTADANGDKIVMEGTVLAPTAGGKAQPHTTDGTSGAAIGVLLRRINVRDADSDVGMVIGGYVRADKCWDNGVFGTVSADSQTALTALGVHFVNYDV